MSTTSTITSTQNRAAAVISATSIFPRPLVPTGILDKFDFEESTPFIGREYPTVNLVDDILNSPDADNLLHDLAYTISSRGVVFFRKQDNLTDEFQKLLVQKLGEASHKPRDSTLHIHPLLNSTHEFGVGDDAISTISDRSFRQLETAPSPDRDDRKGGAATFHSDIQFEPHPADYTSLRLTQVPSSGGDTLWASGYELYDRFSDPYRTFLEGLTATFAGTGFMDAARARPDYYKLYEEPRGHPTNIGGNLVAVHPVVRTNPVTGWKTIFAVGRDFPRHINELSKRESRDLLNQLYQRVEENHDLQVRFRWRNPNDVAIWDNRSTFHSATNDFAGFGNRFGHRTVGIGERPYFDPNSKSRTQDLKESVGDK